MQGLSEKMIYRYEPEYRNNLVNFLAQKTKDGAKTLTRVASKETNRIIFNYKQQMDDCSINIYPSKLKESVTFHEELDDELKKYNHDCDDNAAKHDDKQVELFKVENEDNTKTQKHQITTRGRRLYKLFTTPPEDIVAFKEKIVDLTKYVNSRKAYYAELARKLDSQHRKVQQLSDQAEGTYTLWEQLKKLHFQGSKKCGDGLNGIDVDMNEAGLKWRKAREVDVVDGRDLTSEIEELIKRDEDGDIVINPDVLWTEANVKLQLGDYIIVKGEKYQPLMPYVNLFTQLGDQFTDEKHTYKLIKDLLLREMDKKRKP